MESPLSRRGGLTQLFMIPVVVMGFFQFFLNPHGIHASFFTYSMYLGNNVKLNSCSLFVKLVAKSSNLASTTSGF
jgi:hypothetical protein